MATPYEHQQYRPGLNVYIDLAIREIHPESPLAGQVVTTCIGNEYETLKSFEEQTSFVPVKYNNTVWHVEPEYICVD